MTLLETTCMHTTPSQAVTRGGRPQASTFQATAGAAVGCTAGILMAAAPGMDAECSVVRRMLRLETANGVHS